MNDKSGPLKIIIVLLMLGLFIFLFSGMECPVR